MSDTPAKCPGAPAWNTINAGEKAVWLPANEIIERSYKEEPRHDRDAILVGSDFLDGGEIGLPRSAPHRGYGNVLLSELRGLAKQLRPDIVDFENRVFYEIKSERNAI